MIQDDIGVYRARNNPNFTCACTPPLSPSYGFEFECSFRTEHEHLYCKRYFCDQNSPLFEGLNLFYPYICPAIAPTPHQTI